jgi:hypothetical protein
MLALLGLAVATLQYVAPRAEAVSGLVTVTDASISASDSTSIAIATCPTGTKAYGGGAEVVTDSGTPGSVAVTNFRPSSSLASFSARAYEVREFAGNWHIIATAYCAPPLPGLEFVSANTTPSLQTTQVVRAQCPSGKRAFGGGGGTNLGRGDVLVNSWDPGESDYGVRATVSNPITRNWQVFAYAICAATNQFVFPIFEGTGTQSASPATKSTFSCSAASAGSQVHSAAGSTAGQDGNLVIDKIVANAARTQSVIRAYEKVPTASVWQLFAGAVCAA